MRVELRDGQWVELRERITHGQDKEIRRALARARANPETELGEGDTLALRVFIKAWSVQDIDGNALPLEAPDAIDRLPSDIADDLSVKVVAIYNGTATVPNPSTPPSSDA